MCTRYKCMYFLSGRAQDCLFIWENLWLVARFPNHYTRIRYRPLSLPGVCPRLRTLSPHNVIVDTQMIRHYSLVNTAQEYGDFCSWSAINRLTINIDNRPLAKEGEGWSGRTTPAAKTVTFPQTVRALTS